MDSSSSELGSKLEQLVADGGQQQQQPHPHPPSEARIPIPNTDQLQLYRGLKRAKKERSCSAKERISKMAPCVAGKRSSIYRGVTRHRWTGRYEAHLWDKCTWNQNQNKKGKQGMLICLSRLYSLT
ncbi:hypothetical protein GIB67_040045 [Kingdonia uniflora]|uniref:AP2/ERF domain-containing protein n=1 Tax=Kingdonia uniflora TaxID=39325 RepID=A0A7J7MUB8_9MAGN|nr:hypothetical protein GIB67_040045 [Kingdonia uniflora]